MSQSKTIYNIKELSNDKNYWFFRTNAGLYYADYALNNYIGLGWDEIDDLSLFNVKTDQEEKNLKEKVKSLVSQYYPDENRAGLTAGQIIKFINEMKIGDIVIIPDAGSHSISIGVIESDVYLHKQDTDNPSSLDETEDENLGYEQCPYVKRRKIKWVTSASKHQIDPYLFKLFCVIHTISDANAYAKYIDRIMYPIYMKNGEIHITLNVEQEDSITARSMNKLLSGILGILDNYTNEEVSKEADNLTLKVIVESPGKLEFISKTLSGCAICSSLALLLFGAEITFSCGELNFSAKSQGASGFFNEYIKERNRHEESMANAENKKQIEELKKALADMKVQLPAPIKGNNL